MKAPKPVAAPPGYFSVKVGASYSHNEKLCRVRRLLSTEDLLVEFESGDTARVPLHDLRPASESKPAPNSEGFTENSEASPSKTKGKADLLSYTEKELADAEKTLQIVEPLLKMKDRKRADVEKAAKSIGVSTSAVYEWIRQYREIGHVTAFVKAPCGPKPGSHRLDPAQEAVIQGVLQDKYLKAIKWTPQAAIEEIMLLLHEKGLDLVHANTIRNRINEILPKTSLSARGDSELAGQLYEQRDGTYNEATAPLMIVQIDHVKLDRIIVDSNSRKPLKGRAWLTLAIDIYTRMIAGYYLSLDAPSAFAAGVCMYMAMMSKRALLAKLKLPGQWPVTGKFGSAHMDNAKEFKGEMIRLAGKEHGIDVILRPKKRPHYGAYIESLVGNVNKELHKRKGTTHSNPSVSPDYDPVKNAVYTLAETELDVVDWMVNSYSQAKHSALGMTPLKKWELSILGDATTPGVGLPAIPKDPEKLRLDFMPFKKRVIHPYGVEIDVLKFSADCLEGHINAMDPEDKKNKKQFIFRYDPRSYKKIWFYDDGQKQYFEVPLSERDLQDMSWSEYNAHRKQMRDEGKDATDFSSVAEYLRRVRDREKEASAATAFARKPQPTKAGASAQKSRDNPAPGAAIYAATPNQSESKRTPPKLPSLDDLFNQEIVPFT